MKFLEMIQQENKFFPESEILDFTFILQFLVQYDKAVRILNTNHKKKFKRSQFWVYH